MQPPPDPAFQPPSLSALHCARSAGARARALRQGLRALGFDWYFYGRFAVRHGQVVPSSFRALHGDRRTARRLLAAGWYRSDLLLTAMESPVPWAWHLDELLSIRPKSEAPGHGHLESLWRLGWRGGVTVVLPNAVGGWCSILSIWTRASPIGDDGAAAEALQAAMSLDQVYRLDECPPELSGLGEQHRRILEGVQRGLTDRQIACELRLSPACVDYHLRQLRQRFHARSRLQLAQSAAAQLHDATAAEVNRWPGARSGMPPPLPAQPG